MIALDRTREHPTHPLSAAELTAFAQHKNVLLDNLRAAHRRGPMCQPFDANRTWGALTRAARWYFRRPTIKRATVLPARRVERLRDLARALGRARNMAQKAMQDDVGIDLFRGWCAEANISSFTFNEDGSSALTP